VAEFTSKLKLRLALRPGVYFSARNGAFVKPQMGWKWCAASAKFSNNSILTAGGAEASRYTPLQQVANQMVGHVLLSLVIEGESKSD
jgi:hypothetical protein